MEKLQYEDLEPLESTSTVKINYSHIERYLHGPTLSGFQPPHPCDSESDERAGHLAYMLEELRMWRPDIQNVLTHSVALDALRDLSPGGALMTASHSETSTRQYLFGLLAMQNCC